MKKTSMFIEIIDIKCKFRIKKIYYSSLQESFHTSCLANDVVHEFLGLHACVTTSTASHQNGRFAKRFIITILVSLKSDVAIKGKATLIGQFVAAKES